MNRTAKRHQTKIAIDLLAEVVEEVLQEAQDKGEGGLTATTVAARAGFPVKSNRGGLSRYILDLLSQQKVAINDLPGLGAGSWRLAV